MVDGGWVRVVTEVVVAAMASTVAFRTLGGGRGGGFVDNRAARRDGRAFSRVLDGGGGEPEGRSREEGLATGCKSPVSLSHDCSKSVEVSASIGSHDVSKTISLSSSSSSSKSTSSPHRWPSSSESLMRSSESHP